jgi:hypothetical protein
VGGVDTSGPGTGAGIKNAYVYDLSGGELVDRGVLSGAFNRFINWAKNDSGFLTSEIDSMGEGWVRFKCGLQICYGTVINNNNIETGRARHSYPMAFIAAPSVVATPRHEGMYFVTASGVGTTNWILNSVSAYDGIRYTGDGLGVSYVATGKWK